MRAISTALKSHLASPTTTVCYLLKVMPKFGDAFGITTLDEDVIYDDGAGALTYRAKRGYTQFDVQTANDLSVDNSEASGLLAEYPADGMTAEGIATGQYDSARFVQYLVNYNDLSMGHVVIDSGQVGQVTNLAELTVSIELRSLTQILKQQAMVELTSISCRADFGDFRCKVPFQWYNATVTSVGAENDRTFSVDSFVQAMTMVQFALGNGGTTYQLKDAQGADVTAGFAVTHIYNGATEQIGNWSVSPEGVVTFSSGVAMGAMLYWSGTTSLSPAGTAAGVVTGVPFFEGDGVTTAAFLKDTTGADVLDGFTITHVYLNGTETTSFTVDSAGMVVFGTAPANGVIATWDGTVPLSPDGYFAPGVAEWHTGSNAGRQVDIESFDATTNTFTLLIPTYLPIQVGDTLQVRRDCDKSWTMCTTAFNNGLNFRGEKDLPRADSAELQAPSSTP